MIFLNHSHNLPNNKKKKLEEYNDESPKKKTKKYNNIYDYIKIINILLKTYYPNKAIDYLDYLLSFLYLDNLKKISNNILHTSKITTDLKEITVEEKYNNLLKFNNNSSFLFFEPFKSKYNLKNLKKSCLDLNNKYEFKEETQDSTSSLIDGKQNNPFVLDKKLNAFTSSSDIDSIHHGYESKQESKIKLFDSQTTFVKSYDIDSNLYGLESMLNEFPSSLKCTDADSNPYRFESKLDFELPQLKRTESDNSFTTNLKYQFYTELKSTETDQNLVELYHPGLETSFDSNLYEFSTTTSSDNYQHNTQIKSSASSSTSLLLNYPPPGLETNLKKSDLGYDSSTFYLENKYGKPPGLESNLINLESNTTFNYELDKKYGKPPGLESNYKPYLNLKKSNSKQYNFDNKSNPNIQNNPLSPKIKYNKCNKCGFMSQTEVIKCYKNKFRCKNQSECIDRLYKLDNNSSKQKEFNIEIDVEKISFINDLNELKLYLKKNPIVNFKDLLNNTSLNISSDEIIEYSKSLSKKENLTELKKELESITYKEIVDNVSQKLDIIFEVIFNKNYSKTNLNFLISKWIIYTGRTFIINDLNIRTMFFIVKEIQINYIRNVYKNLNL